MEPFSTSVTTQTERERENMMFCSHGSRDDMYLRVQVSPTVTGFQYDDEDSLTR